MKLVSVASEEKAMGQRVKGEKLISLYNLFWTIKIFDQAHEFVYQKVLADIRMQIFKNIITYIFLIQLGLQFQNIPNWVMWQLCIKEWKVI